MQKTYDRASVDKTIREPYHQPQRGQAVLHLAHTAGLHAENRQVTGRLAAYHISIGEKHSLRMACQLHRHPYQIPLHVPSCNKYHTVPHRALS